PENIIWLPTELRGPIQFQVLGHFSTVRSKNSERRKSKSPMEEIVSISDIGVPIIIKKIK
ncbi:hypothetical protein STEG23_037969, partial [Scotinomys teguina]